MRGKSSQVPQALTVPQMVLVVRRKLRQPDMQKALFMGPVYDNIHQFPCYLRKNQAETEKGKVQWPAGKRSDSGPQVSIFSWVSCPAQQGITIMSKTRVIFSSVILQLSSVPAQPTSWWSLFNDTFAVFNLVEISLIKV